MKIQCKNCAKIYLVSIDQIGKSGRKVKCTSCNYVWYEYPPNELPSAGTQAKKGNFLAFTTFACVTFMALCFVIVSPGEVKRVYNTYKDSISYKLSGYKKEQANNSYTRKFATTNELHQDYLFLSHLKSS
ncbi:zinc-ribbon domain-containing protein [Wolbachia endosymbiont of Pentalonia nigronervosa]|jgi:predicted Zn finger-like uncharacterized protein|uniref:MJ0042-type zinc finger domain-containing protein n=1 Tax=Wolbachia endosymbiont of Pentalonia nigronervosa TaxID=1301914 RepID=UPI00165FD295|nr:MJ0042-type zinc finger domain-containing protein [Wolbachia endosymbiont of Pentalonia nigronervosa]MBD0391753.1 zinc-ribbon domain-containing protein [Wolbachia endosymbiont of Pentalonia nigronervosa]